jgi:nitroreductase
MLELLKTRRSIRKYQDWPVEREKIDTILKAALLAPSSRSIRPWEFIAVTDKELLSKLSQCRKPMSGYLAQAPLCVVVTADRESCDVWVEDCSITAIIMQLTAHSMGLGSCWIQIRKRNHDEERSADDYIRSVLHVPEKYSVECIIAIGYSAEEKKAYTEEQLAYNKLHYNDFNQK